MAAAADRYNRLIKWAETILFFCLCFAASLLIAPENAPDESMRYALTEFIYKNGSLPFGNESEIMNPVWGFSYAFYPYLTSIISAGFMKLASITSAEPTVLLAAARFTSVICGTGTVMLAFNIAGELFHDKKTALLTGTLVAFLPQFIFICSYQNNDCFAVFCSALIIYFWIKALKYGWSMSSCIGLGIGCGLCALSYYNAYGFILFSIIIFCADNIRRKQAISKIIKSMLTILIAALAIGAWFFIRNAMLHNGDFLGMQTLSQTSEQFAAEEFRPSVMDTPARRGLSFTDTFIRNSGYQNTAWLPTVAGSFIGAFGNMTVKLPMVMYGIYFLLFLTGAAALLAAAVRKKKIFVCYSRSLAAVFIILIFINLILFMTYTYFSSYQAQGRYMMPSLLPLMILISAGYGRLGSRSEKKHGLLLYTLILIFPVMALTSYFAYMLPGCA